MRKMGEVLDAETGEVLGKVILPGAKAKKRGPFKGEFVMMLDSGLEGIAADKGLSGCDLRVFMAIAAGMGYGNKPVMNQAKIAKMLGLKQGPVSRSCRKLVDKGYVECVKLPGLPKGYAAARQVAFKGRARK